MAGTCTLSHTADSAAGAASSHTACQTHCKSYGNQCFDDGLMAPSQTAHNAFAAFPSVLQQHCSVRSPPGVELGERDAGIAWRAETRASTSSVLPMTAFSTVGSL